jgi:hypothetical protein
MCEILIYKNQKGKCAAINRFAKLKTSNIGGFATSQLLELLL